MSPKSRMHRRPSFVRRKLPAGTRQAELSIMEHGFRGYREGATRTGVGVSVQDAGLEQLREVRVEQHLHHPLQLFALLLPVRHKQPSGLSENDSCGL